MSVLTQTEKKSVVGRLFLTGVLVTLILGSITMIYPFVLMVSGSLRSEMDGADLSAIPLYLVDGDELARKFLETKYNYDVGDMNLFRGHQDFSFRQATLPKQIVPQRIEDLQRFARETDIPDHWWGIGGTYVYRSISSANSTRFVNRLRVRYEDNLNELGEDLGSPIPKWRYVSAGIPQWEDPRWRFEQSPFYETYYELLHARPVAERAFSSISGWFLQNIIFPEYGKSDTAAYNLAHAESISDFKEFSIPRTVPGLGQPKLRDEWTTYVRGVISVTFIRTMSAADLYQGHLASHYASIADLNKRWGTQFISFDEIKLPRDKEWIDSGQRQDYIAFLATRPVEDLYLVGPEFAWYDWMKTTYGNLEAANLAHQRDATSWSDLHIPMDELELEYVRNHTGELRRESAGRNYRTIFSEIIFQGRPLMNTLIFVFLSLLFSLTLQPLAAYSLSRFNPPGTWRIILIFMATMAFPPMVGMIPQFLILRNLNLLNTFAGLVLPGLVNGYLIFLLKGFFDSLPKHLYEAALIDGAGEIRMFFTLTMSLSKPILAVVALGTFNHAWLAFLYPLLVCPSEEMHVLAIWLYQFQQDAPTSAVFASILITSIPCLLIFAFTQRTIMKGIAVPAEK